MSEINPVEFGKLLNAVEGLQKDVEMLHSSVQELNDKITLSRGMAYGSILFVGGLGAGVTKLLEKFTS